MQAPIPIIRIFDEEKAKAFYVHYLGFTVDWEHRFEPTMPIYFQISQGNCLIHLSEHPGDCTPGAALRIAVADLVAFHQHLQSKDYSLANPSVVTQPWGFYEMNITDPFGNRMIFCQPIV